MGGGAANQGAKYLMARFGDVNYGEPYHAGSTQGVNLDFRVRPHHTSEFGRMRAACINLSRNPALMRFRNSYLIRPQQVLNAGNFFSTRRGPGQTGLCSEPVRRSGVARSEDKLSHGLTRLPAARGTNLTHTFPTRFRRNFSITGTRAER